jgi:hypothetical protein
MRVKTELLDEDSPEMQILGWITSEVDRPNDVGERHDWYLGQWKLERGGQA